MTEPASATTHARLIRQAGQRRAEAAGLRRLADDAEADAQRLAERAAALDASDGANEPQPRKGKL